MIPSALAQQIDDGSALDELSDRVETALGPLASKTQWGVGKQKWLSAVRTVEKSLQRPDVPTADEHQEMVRELDEVRAALAYTENEVDEWKRKFDELEKAKDATEARRIRVGGSPLDQFHAAVAHAKSTISQLPPPVREAIYQSLRGSSVPYPNRFEDPYATDEFDDAIERRLLVEEDDNLYAPNRDKGRVAEAIEAVEQLTNAISVEKAGPDFPEWFAGEYDGLDPDLRDRDCWEELLG